MMRERHPSILGTRLFRRTQRCKHFAQVMCEQLRTIAFVSVTLAGLVLSSDVAVAQWTTPVLIDPNSGVQGYPLIAVGPQRQIAVSWTENDAVVYTSWDNGSSFIRHTIPVLPPPPVVYFEVSDPEAVAFDRDQNLFILWKWTDITPAFPVAEYLTLSKSTDGGNSFAAFWRKVQPYFSVAKHPLVIDSNKTIHIVWDSLGTSLYPTMVYTRFVNGDLQNRIDVNLPRPPGSYSKEHASLLVRGNAVHFVSDAFFNYKLYYTRSTDGGASFGEMMQIDTSDSFSPQLVTVVNGHVALLFGETDHAPPKARYVLDSPITFSEPLTLGNASFSFDQKITLKGHTPDNYVVYGGASVSSYYAFENLENGPFDSSTFPTLTRPHLDLDSIGGKYLVAYSVNDSRVYFTKKDVVSSSAEAPNIPTESDLKQNYPNPFNPTTTLSFDLPEQSTVSLIVYDVLGRKIAELAAGSYPAGYHSATWNATDQASGVYFARFTATALGGKPIYSKVNKLVLMK